ncbi:MAG: hypothetical protein KatS3mg029_0868 [Saprospiraceae bacterium]|nr:MAG: hypothetical protein KatS3mg029_0868 [Saprospiraceae bacterium]
MKKLLPIILATVLLSQSSVFSQVTISGQQINTCSGVEITMDVTADNWNGIVSAQFPVTWDPSILTFVSVFDSMPASALYNVDSAMYGILKFSWFDFTPPADTFFNGKVLFKLTFQVNGSYGSSSMVDFNSIPSFELEIAKPSGVIPNGDILINPGQVNVQDNAPPALSSCPADTTVHVPNGISSASVSWVPPSASDNCPGVLLSSTHNPGDAFPVGTTTVTYTATDGAGNTTTCSFMVTVVENPPPPSDMALIIGDVQVICPQGSVSVPVTHQNLFNMTSFQFGIVWDETILQYDSVTSNLPPVALFNANNASNGELRASWFDANPADTLTDTLLFTLHFTILTNDFFTTDINFSDLNNFPIEVANSSGIIPNGDIVFEEGTITIIDDVPPILLGCPTDTITVNNSSGVCEAAVTWTPPTASDNCSTVTLASTHNPGDVFGVGVTMVTYTATDFHGNTASCSFHVEVLDTESPTINDCPGNITQDNDPGICTASVSWMEPTADDNCPGVSINGDAMPGDEFPVGTTTVTYTATDASGNTSTCSFTITIEDVEPPTLDACPVDIVQNNDPGGCNASVKWTEPTADDNCPGVTLSSTHTPGSPIAVGTVTVTYTATDASGNTATCSFQVTVVDAEDPNAVCQDITVGLDANGMATITPNDVDGGSTDNCGIDSMHVAPSAFDCDSIGERTVVLTVFDAAGNSSSCTALVTVVDAVPPTALCANITVQLDDTGMASITPNDIDDGSSDNCGIDSLHADPSTFDCNAIGDNSVILTATDLSGNTATCSATVTVQDTIRPSAVCQDITVSLDSAGMVSVSAAQVDGGSTDNCGIDSMHVAPSAFDCDSIGERTVVLTVFDAAGNTDTCSATLTITDDMAPTFACPADTVVFVPIGVTDTVVNDIGLVDVADNCGVDSIWFILTGATTGGGDDDASGTSFAVGETTVTYYVQDASGNLDSCSFTVTVKEAGLSITCPMNIATVNDVDSCSAIVPDLEPTISPADSLAFLFYQITGATNLSGQDTIEGVPFQVGTSVATYIAVSTNQDTLTCQFQVVVTDTQMPYFLNCPTTDTVGVSQGMCSRMLDVDMLPPAADNCSFTYQTIPALGTLLSVGTSPLSVQIEDPAGHTAICTYNVTVVDDEPPAIQGCPADITANSEFNKCSALVQWIEPVATDNCDLIAFTPSQGPGTSFNVGVTPVEYVAVDASGNVSKCTFNVTVIDVQPPLIQGCVGSSTVGTDAGQCTATVSWPEPTAMDNCQVVNIVGNLTPPATLGVGSHNVTYIATDAAGLTDTCSFTITVEDNEPPAIAPIPGNVVLQAPAGLCGASYSWPIPLATDNCGIDTFMVSHVPGSFFPIGTTEVKFIAVDINGNATVKTFEVTVLDNTPPAFNCPASVVVDAEGQILSDPSGFMGAVTPIDCESAQLDFGAVTATDDCGIATLAQTEGLPTGSIFPLGTTQMTFVAIDNHGNLATCSFTITVQPIDALTADAFPAVACQGEDVLLFATEYADASYTWLDPLGVPVGNDPELFLPAVDMNSGGLYTVVVTFPWGCELQATTTVTVAPVPSITATANDLQCLGGTSDLLLMAQDTAFAGVVDWVWEFPNGSLVFQQNPVVNNATAANSGTYFVTGITDVGCSATASVNVVITDKPSKPYLTGTESAACVGQSIVLTGQPFAGNDVKYHWSASPMTGSGLTPINNSTVQVKPTAAGDYYYYYVVEVNGCTSDTAEWFVNVQAKPNLTLAVDGQTKCVDGTTSITLMATGQASSWLWEGTNTLFTSNDQNPVISNVTSANSDIYKLTATTSNGCVSTATINVQITDQPPAPTLVASATELCAGAQLTLSATPAYGAGAQFLWTGNNLPPFASSVQTITTTPTATGALEYTFAAVVNGCTTSVASVTVMVEMLPAVNITVDGQTQCVPANNTITLHSNVANAASWKWTNQNGTVLGNGPSLQLTNANASKSGTYTVVVSNALGCSSSGSVTLNITNALPTVTASLLEKACLGGVIHLGATLIPGASYEWKGPSGKTVALVPEPIIQNASPALNGNYTVTVTKDGCSTTSAPVLVQVATEPVAQNDRFFIEVATPTVIDVLLNDNTSGNVTIDVLQPPMHGGLANQGNGKFTYSPRAKFRENDQFIYEVCDKACPDLCDFALVTLEVRYPADTCVIVNVFTPNEDGINDAFVISCLELEDYPNNHLIVFNEWGDKVFEAQPYKNDWKGHYNGSDLPDGTYYYIFQLDKDSPVQKGFVMIHR